MVMIISEDECECRDLELPRWDIYICDFCGRQLAFIDEPALYDSSIWSRITRAVKKVLRYNS